MHFYSQNHFITDFFLYSLLLYSIFSISFSQEEQIHVFFAFTSHKVFKRIINCSNTKAFGPDMLSIFHLKNLGAKAIEYLTALFNDSVTSCLIPAIWRSSIFLYQAMTLLYEPHIGQSQYSARQQKLWRLSYHCQHRPAPSFWPTQIPTRTLNHFCSTITDEWCLDRLQSKEPATSNNLCRCWTNSVIRYSQP